MDRPCIGTTTYNYHIGWNVFKLLRVSTHRSMLPAPFGAAPAKPRSSLEAPAKLQRPRGLSASGAHPASVPKRPLDGCQGRRYPNALHRSSILAVLRAGFAPEPREFSPLDADEMTGVPGGLQGRDEWA